jgi:hypothetical protein
MSKKLGELAELKFYTIAYENNFIISKPFGDNARYDFIVDCNGKLSRVQVKSTSYIDRANRENRYSLVVGYGNKCKISYTENDIDIVAIFVFPENIWYIIQINKLDGKKKINLRPFDKNSKGKYEIFKMAWELFY